MLLFFGTMCFACFPFFDRVFHCFKHFVLPPSHHHQTQKIINGTNEDDCAVDRASKEDRYEKRRRDSVSFAVCFAVCCFPCFACSLSLCSLSFSLFLSLSLSFSLFISLYLSFSPYIYIYIYIYICVCVCVCVCVYVCVCVCALRQLETRPQTFGGFAAIQKKSQYSVFSFLVLLF